MTAVTDTPNRRGRPRAFDEDEVLDTLIALFWEQGFEACSLNEIVDAAGLNKSSLYNAFGSKEELFITVLDRYVDHRQAVLDEALADGGIDALVAFFEMQREQMMSEIGCRGCMAVNASTELGMRDQRVVEVGDRYRAMLRGVIHGSLTISAERGEIMPSLVDVYADSVLSVCLGLAVSARSGAAVEELSQMIDSMLALIRSWRL